MSPLTRQFIMPALLFCWLGFVSSAAAVFPPPVKDEAKFFSMSALDKANKKIKEIYRDYHLDVVVETMPAIPADLQAKYKEEGKNRFFSEWVRKRIDDQGVHGVYILIS